MKASDTVMNAAVIDTRLCNYAINFNTDDMHQIQKIVETQAEISFNAGIKEVVEWGDEQCSHSRPPKDTSTNYQPLVLIPYKKRECDICWQSKLKDWGIGE